MFKKFLVFALFLVLSGPALADMISGEKYLDEMEIIADALESVHDEDSAIVAAELMGQAIARATVRANEVESWSDAEKRAFYVQYGERFRLVHTRISQAMLPIIQNPDYGELFILHMQSMPRVGE